MSLYAHVVRYPDLFLNILRRELHGKYRGSFLGLFWTLVNPLADMAFYTLVFSVLLKAFEIEHYLLSCCRDFTRVCFRPADDAGNQREEANPNQRRRTLSASAGRLI